MNVVIAGALHLTSPFPEIPPSLGRELRRADDFIRTALLTSHQLFADMQVMDPAATVDGLFLGTAFGPMQTNFEVLDLIVEQNQTSPTLFSHSVFNAAAGYISRIFGIKGHIQTCSDFAWPFFHALREGYLAIASGKQKSCLILQVEIYSRLLEDCRSQLDSGSPEWKNGATALLLTKVTPGMQGYRIKTLEVNTLPASPDFFLKREERLFFNQMDHTFLTNPLAAGAFVVNALNSKKNEPLDIAITAPYGDVRLILEQKEDKNA